MSRNDLSSPLRFIAKLRNATSESLVAPFPRRLWQGDSVTRNVSGQENDDRKVFMVSRLVVSLTALVTYLGAYSTTVKTATQTATIAILAVYIVMCAAICVASARQKILFGFTVARASVFDVATYTLLLSLGNLDNKILFFGLLFSILVMSTQRGLFAGRKVAIACALMLLITELVFSQKLELWAVILNCLAITIMGYAAAYLGEAELKYRGRFLLLKNITNLANPRFGVDRTLGLVMQQLREFFEGDICVLVAAEAETARYSLRRVDQHKPERAMGPEAISPDVAERLLALPSAHALAFRTRRASWFTAPTRNLYGYDMSSRSRVVEDPEMLESIAELLDAPSFLTVPIKLGHSTRSRLYILSRRANGYDDSDVDLILQAVSCFMPVVDNIRLVDRLATDAAEQERHRIARDLHDTTIQPFIGLQMGLTAVHKKLVEGRGDVTADIVKLLQLTDVELGDLRSYVRNLKEREIANPAFLMAIRRFVEKFSDASGIHVELVVEGELSLSDRLAAEAFQLVAEGLSNIRRHTQSTFASIKLGCGESSFDLHITNTPAQNDETTNFMPRSISERTAALGGELSIDRGHDGSTNLHVSIPL